MNRYFIDASVYGLPFEIPNVITSEIRKKLENPYNNYIENLNNLFKILSPNKLKNDNFLRVNKYIYSNNDISLLQNNKLFFDEDNLSRNISILKSFVLDEKKKSLVYRLVYYYINILVKIPRYSKSDLKPRWVSIFENYFGFRYDNIEITDNSSFPDFYSNSINNILSSNLKKNLHLLAFLNKSIFKSNDKLCILTTINIEKFKLSFKVNSIPHNFKNIPQTEMYIESSFVKNIYLNDYFNKNIKYSSIKELIISSIKEKTFDKNIVFNHNIGNNVSVNLSGDNVPRKEFFPVFG